MQDRLLELCREGDQAAQKQFYRSHIDTVFGICLRMLGDREKAKDAAQETFIKAFSRLEQFRNEAEITTWLYRIATNASLDMLRLSRTKTVSLDDDDHPVHNRAELAQQPAHAQSPLEEVVRKVLATGSQEWAETFWLFTIDQLSQKDIAEMQRISLATVKMRLAKVRDILKSKLQGNRI
jgi:RNA polymerase sigma-70 factor (ECF subfamily)